jgi:hypothetical protein
VGVDSLVGVPAGLALSTAAGLRIPRVEHATEGTNEEDGPLSASWQDPDALDG